jgi:hypothetical protein
MEVLPSHKQMFLLFHSQHVSAQINHHQVMREKYTNDDWINITMKGKGIVLFLIFKFDACMSIFNFKSNVHMVLSRMWPNLTNTFSNLY